MASRLSNNPMKHYYYNGYDPMQRQLQATTHGFVIAFKLLFRALIFAPLIFTGYLLATQVLDKKAHGLLWITVILLFAGLLYAAIMVLKNIICDLKGRQNYWWVPLFLICIAFTCILSAWLIYEPLNRIVIRMKGTPNITRLVVFCFTVYVYFQYDFLGHKQPSNKKAC